MLVPLFQCRTFPRRGFFVPSLQQGRQLIQILCHLNEIRPMTTYETLCLKVIEHTDERLPKTFHVIEHHALVVIAYGMRPGDSKHFVERADTTRQSHANVALSQHNILAVAKIVARNFNVKVIGTPTLPYNVRNNANGHSAAVVNRLPYAVHQTAVGTAKHQRMTMLAHPMTKRLGKRKEITVNLFIGRTKYCYFHLPFNLLVCILAAYNPALSLQSYRFFI